MQETAELLRRHILMDRTCWGCGKTVEVAMACGEVSGTAYGGHVARCPECGWVLGTDFPDYVIRAAVASRVLFRPIV